MGVAFKEFGRQPAASFGDDLEASSDGVEGLPIF
jgi:hypothetical protein